MRFEELKKGDLFYIDGAPYEAETIGERIVVAFVLDEKLLATTHPSRLDLARTIDPKDLAGWEYLTTAFSDLRFNANNLTDFERQCDEELKALL